MYRFDVVWYRSYEFRPFLASAPSPVAVEYHDEVACFSYKYMTPGQCIISCHIIDYRVRSHVHV